MLRENLDATEGKEQLSGLRLAMGNRGEQIDGSANPKGLNFNAPAMVIIGASPERIAALRSGGAPIEAKSHAPELPAPASDTEEMEFDVTPPRRST